MCHIVSSLMESYPTKVVVMCHYPIGETFHKVAFHMKTHEWFFFCKSEDCHMSNFPPPR